MLFSSCTNSTSNIYKGMYTNVKNHGWLVATVRYYRILSTRETRAVCHNLRKGEKAGSVPFIFHIFLWLFTTIHQISLGSSSWDVVAPNLSSWLDYRIVPLPLGNFHNDSHPHDGNIQWHPLVTIVPFHMQLDVLEHVVRQPTSTWQDLWPDQSNQFDLFGLVCGIQ